MTNTVHKSTRILAFYHPSTDDLYIRANFKGGKGPAVLAVCHELGHRLQLKFLKSKGAEINQLYAILGSQEKDRLQELIKDKSNHPTVGDTFTEGRSTYIVDSVVGYEIHLHKNDDPRQKAKLPLMSWVRDKVKTSAPKFVTPYASTSAGENFAEMVAYYVSDLLPKDQVNMLEGLL